MTTLRTVLVGCGQMSKEWVRVARTLSDFEIVGFVDLDREVAQQRADEYGDVTHAVVSTDFEAMLQELSPDIVFDCTVPAAHAPVTTTALKHGCHVLGEKPMADSMENARRMVQMAQETGKLYAVIQNRRYDPNIRRLRRFIDSQTVGVVTTINSDFFIAPHFGGFRDQMQHVLLLDMAIHTFDAARYLCKADPVSVYCKEWNPAGSWYAHGASAVAIFEMTNGIIYIYRGSWCAEGLPTTWESDWRIIGQQGTVKWDGNGHMIAQRSTQTGNFFSEHEDVDIPLDQDDLQGGHSSIIREFVECVRTGTIPETICTDNIKSLAMVFGAMESAETGKEVAIYI